jgi:transposase
MWGPLSAQGMDVSQIAQVTFTSPDRVRDVLHNFNLDGFDALYPRYRGGRPPTFALAQRRAITQFALSRPVDHALPFSTWSLAKLAELLVAEGWSTTSATRACGSCSARRACPIQ